MYTREQIQSTIESKGYKYFTDDNNKGYDVNIIGIRNSKTKGRVTNAFDDLITISYKVDGEWHYHEFNCTTDPGSHWVENILNDKGVAILKPGQYRGSHKLRLHQGKYLNEATTTTGLFGINIHRATSRSGGKSTRIDKWSAGCQVIADNDDWHEFLDICQAAREIHGNSFSYTLIESNEIA